MSSGPYVPSPLRPISGKTKRICLKCNEPFKSALPPSINRICDHCTKDQGKVGKFAGAGTGTQSSIRKGPKHD